MSNNPIGILTIFKKMVGDIKNTFENSTTTKGNKAVEKQSL